MARFSYHPPESPVPQTTPDSNLFCTFWGLALRTSSTRAQHAALKECSLCSEKRVHRETNGTFVTRKDLSVIPRIKANIPYSCSNLSSSWYKPNCPTPELR